MAVYDVPTPTLEQAAGIAQRIYAGLVAVLKLFKFAHEPSAAVLDKLAGVSPREMRKTLLRGWDPRRPMGAMR